MSIKYKVLLSVLCLFPLVGCQREEISNIRTTAEGLSNDNRISFVLKDPVSTKASSEGIRMAETKSDLSDDGGSMSIRSVYSPMDMPETKVTETTDLSSFKVLAYHKNGTSYVRDWEEEFAGGPVYTSVDGHEWPAEDPSYGFIAFDKRLTVNAYQAAGISFSRIQYSGEQIDYVYATNPSPDYRERNELEFKHVFARLGSITVVANPGQTLSNINIRLAQGYYGGIFRILYGSTTAAAFTSSMGYGDNLSLFVSNSPGIIENDILLNPSEYTIKASYRSIVGGTTTDYTDVTAKVKLVAGEKTDLVINLNDGAGSPSIDVGYFYLEIADVPDEPYPGRKHYLVCENNLTYSLNGDGLQHVFYNAGSSQYLPHLEVKKGDIIGLKGDIGTGASASTIKLVDVEPTVSGGTITYGLPQSDYSNVVPSNITKVYAYGYMAALNDNGSKSATFNDLFNADIPYSIGSVLYNHPTISISFPYVYTQAEPLYKYPQEVPPMTFARCFKGTKISYVPTGLRYLSSFFSNYYSANSLYLNANDNLLFTDCFANCVNLVGHESDRGLTEEYHISIELKTNKIEGIFSGCTSITSAEVGAEGNRSDTGSARSTIAARMFEGCSSLSKIRALIGGPSSNNYYPNWVNGVAPSGVFTAYPSDTGWDVNSPNCVPVGWPLPY